MGARKASIIMILGIVLVLGSYFFLDKPIALFVKNRLMLGFAPSLFAANIPDFLFFLVCAVTGIAWAAYLYDERKGIYNVHRRFFLLIAHSVPLSFLVKIILKFLIGRIDTRIWIYNPGLAEFHWFRGVNGYTGFPSGHMAVFTVLAVAVATYYPRSRPACTVILLVLATALIATNHHFLSDVIAGVCLGWLVHLAARDLVAVLWKAWEP